LTLQTQGGKLFFNYVFASEEYNEFVNLSLMTYLDSSWKKYFALIPGTKLTVINTVNGGNPLALMCNQLTLYTIMTHQLLDTGYDGSIDVFTAQA